MTVKIRTGWSPENAVACDIARVIEDCGADAITVHPRYATHGYAVPADWTVIRQVKACVKIPVIGNGDVFEPFQALKMRQETGCDGVMIGRGAIGNPWIFKQVLHLDRGIPVSKPDLSERRSFIMNHFQALADLMGPHRAARSMRGLLLWYTKGLPHSGRFRGGVNKIKDLDSLIATMDDYFSILKDAEH